MSTYIEAFKGYIADVPKMWFKRCDGNVYYFDELTQAQVQPNTNFTEINAGHSLYPVAYIPGQSTMTMNITSGQFSADMFAMANDVDFEDGKVYDEEEIEIGSVEKKISVWPTSGTTGTFEDVPEFDMDTLTVNGQTAEDDEFVFVDDYGDGVSITWTVTAEYEDGVFTYTVVKTPEGTPTVPSLATRKFVFEAYNSHDAKIAKIDNKKVATGEAVLKWPVYASGEDCTDQAIKGYVVLRLYRARVTQLPGFDSSYKTAGTYSFELSAMDPKRNDRKIYDIAYMDVDAHFEPIANGYPYWFDGEESETVDGVTLTANNGIFTLNGDYSSFNGDSIIFIINGESLYGLNGDDYADLLDPDNLVPPYATDIGDQNTCVISYIDGDITRNGEEEEGRGVVYVGAGSFGQTASKLVYGGATTDSKTVQFSSEPYLLITIGNSSTVEYATFNNYRFKVELV